MIYIAGSWSNRKEIKEEWISLFGDKVIHDWTINETTDRSPENQTKWALLDARACQEADVVLAVISKPQSNEDKYCGTMSEISMAWMAKTPVVMYYPFEILEDGNATPGWSSNVFPWLPHVVWCSTKEDALGFVDHILRKELQFADIVKRNLKASYPHLWMDEFKSKCPCCVVEDITNKLKIEKS